MENKEPSCRFAQKLFLYKSDLKRLYEALGLVTESIIVPLFKSIKDSQEKNEQLKLFDKKEFDEPQKDEFSFKLPFRSDYKDQFIDFPVVIDRGRFRFSKKLLLSRMDIFYLYESFDRFVREYGPKKYEL